MSEFTELICKKLNIDTNMQLKRSIRGLKGYTAYQLIEALIHTNSVKEAAHILGYTENPVKISIRELLHPVFPHRKTNFASGFSARTWKITLLSEIGYRECFCCKKILPENDFKARAKNTDGIGSYCFNCTKSKKSAERYYIVERTPEWSELELIAEFYSNCPKGYHVDHIIPLRGKLVSGLHVISNLQYLPARENISKNNKFDIEIFNS